jgi:hypothetical protein
MRGAVMLQVVVAIEIAMRSTSTAALVVECMSIVVARVVVGGSKSMISPRPNTLWLKARVTNG